MSVTVNYKGSAITTITNGATKTLTTSGTWMEDDVEIINSYKGYFYVYCSSNCDVYKIAIPDTNDWTFDLTTLVHTNYFYGGYASLYRGASETFTSEILETKTFTNNIWNDSTGTAYTGSSQTAWTSSTTYTDCGFFLKPTINTVYYLREIPDDYLRTKFILHYDNNLLTTIYPLTACPDAILIGLGEIGYKTVSSTTSKLKTLMSSSGISTQVNIDEVAYTAKNSFNGRVDLDKTLSVPRGYLTPGDYMRIFVSNLADNTSLKFTPIYITKDCIQVYGKYTSIINIGSRTEATITTSDTLFSETKYTIFKEALTTNSVEVTPTENEQIFYSNIKVNAMPSGSATTPTTTITANPSISVNASGLITATANASQSITPTVNAGYVSAGTAGTITVFGSNTQQLTIKAAATITPGTTNQTIASGTYLTGTQTIAGDADLVASNIKSGVTIFGITGSYTAPTYTNGDNLSYGGN